jgi:arsenate reductase
MMRVLFLCTGNSCRSQMAEGLTRSLKGDIIEASSAGIEPKALDPRAVRVMKEIGIDISNHRSKHVDELMHIEFDYVITVCGHANENCPFFPGKTGVVHFGFEDPPKLAEDSGSEEEALNHYRRIRDEIQSFVKSLPGVLDEIGDSANHLSIDITLK